MDVEAVQKLVVNAERQGVCSHSRIFPSENALSIRLFARLSEIQLSTLLLISSSISLSVFAAFF